MADPPRFLMTSVRTALAVSVLAAASLGLFAAARSRESSAALPARYLSSLRANSPQAAFLKPTPRRPCLGKRPQRKHAHVVWIVFENKQYSQIVGSADAPYINRIANACGVAVNFYAEAHPSLPNYIAMTSGSTQGISDDSGPSSHPLSVPSIFSQLGTGWAALAEDMPSNCYLSNSGSYVVRHNPAVYYTNIRGRCARQSRPLTSRARFSARFTFVIPNYCHSMHSCSNSNDVQNGDTWLSTFLPRILGSTQYKSGNTLVFITWDEDDYHSSQHIPTLVIAPSVRPGAKVRARLDHYSMLRTAEELLGLHTYLGGAASARSMRKVFHLG